MPEAARQETTQTPCSEDCKLWGNPHFSRLMEWVVDRTNIPEATLPEGVEDPYAGLTMGMKDLAVRCHFRQLRGACSGLDQGQIAGTVTPQEL